MFSNALNSRLVAKKLRLRNDIRACRWALDSMERDLNNDVDYPALTAARGSFASLLSTAGAVETLAEAISDMAR